MAGAVYMKRCHNKACRAELDPDQDTIEEPLCEACQAEAEGEREMYEDLLTHEAQE